jgi:hypothetical protein
MSHKTQRWTMTRILGRIPLTLLALGVLTVSTPAFSQPVPTCFDCTFGLYDEPELIHPFGDIVPFTFKDIYMGVKFASPETGLTVAEFSISGLQEGSNLLLGAFEPVTPIPPNFIYGSPPAPPDTSATSTGQGGMDAAWHDCVIGSQALFRLRLMAMGPIANHVLRIMHRFPTSNPNYLRSPIYTRCDSPFFTPVRVTGLDYTLNGVVSVEGNSWSVMKQLYR